MKTTKVPNLFDHHHILVLEEIMHESNIFTFLNFSQNLFVNPYEIMSFLLNALYTDNYTFYCCSKFFNDILNLYKCMFNSLLWYMRIVLIFYQLISKTS